MTKPAPTSTHVERDRGAILPIVLVVSVVLSVVVMAVANYTATSLRYGQVVEARAGRLAAAQGAMDDALEQLSIRASLCATQAGNGAGLSVPFPETINDSEVAVRCRIAGGEVPPSDGWAIVVTGRGAPADGSPTFRFTLGGEPEIGGPVYVHDPQRVTFSQETTIVEGDLWTRNDECAVSFPEFASETQFQRSTYTIPNLKFDPTSRGINCVNRSWDQLFGNEPPVPQAALDALPSNPAHEMVGSCRVFREGQYTASLPLGSNNYFLSGNYRFHDLGTVLLDGQKVTMGQSDAEGFPIIGNTACDAVRTGAASLPEGWVENGLGATVYVSGNTNIFLSDNSGFEVAGRRQGNGRVGMQDIGSTLVYGSPLLASDTGARKEIAINGLLWAPDSSLVFGTIPSQKAAALRGGAIVARLEGGVSASAIGFVIEVPTSPTVVKLVLDSTAEDDRASNTVRAVVDYRPSTGDVAINSRRVVP